MIRRNPKFSKTIKDQIADQAIYMADMGISRGEHPIREAERQAPHAISFIFKSINHTKKDLQDAEKLYMDIFMYAYFGIGKNQTAIDLYKENSFPGFKSEKVPNPPKGSFTKKFSDKWTEYYEEAYKQYKDKSKAAKIAWSRIKHKYEKSPKSGKWILKKTKKLIKKSK